MSKYQIEISDITKIYGLDPTPALEMINQGRTKSEIKEMTGLTVGLKNVSLQISTGEIFVVMGLSGSGKSTLIRHFNRLIEPTSGHIYFNGENILEFNQKKLEEFRRTRMSMVFQHFGLLPHLSVLENVLFGLRLQKDNKRNAKELEEYAIEWINRVGLAGYQNEYPKQLSGGMQQRVGLARALAADTDVILMDEAFSGLDPLIRREMQDQLIHLHDVVGKTIIFITHDLDEALRLGDKIAILKDGEVVQVGTGEDIIQAPANSYVKKFVEDVNRGRVLTTGKIKLDAEVIRTNLSPEEALKSFLSQDLNVKYVVDENGKLIGAVSREKLSKVPAGQTSVKLEDLIEPVPSAEEDMVLEEALTLTLKSDLPIAITDENGVVRGMLSRKAIIAALAEYQKENTVI